jgi:hypothetical protein
MLRAFHPRREFNEAINPASVQTWDLVLGVSPGAVVTGVTSSARQYTARFTISGITTQGVLTANVMAGRSRIPLGTRAPHSSPSIPWTSLPRHSRLP